jgi:hypothetical protein
LKKMSKDPLKYDQPSYRAASYWVRFEYPFWWNNVVAALDSVSRIGLTLDDPHVKRAVGWLCDHQAKDGLWQVSYVNPKEKEKQTAKTRETKLRISLAICRVLKRLIGTETGFRSN